MDTIVATLSGSVCFKGNTVHKDGSAVISPIWTKWCAQKCEEGYAHEQWKSYSSNMQRLLWKDTSALVIFLIYPRFCFDMLKRRQRKNKQDKKTNKKNKDKIILQNKNIKYIYNKNKIIKYNYIINYE